MIDDMQVYIANLGKYNEGELVGDWFSFPLDEEVIAERIGLNAEYEEYAIHDTDNFPMEISEYISIEELNRIYEQLEELPEYLLDDLDSFVSYYGSLEELVEHKDDIILYSGCETMTDLAYYLIDEEQVLGEIPSSLQNYIDYEAYGRVVALEENVTFTEQGYVWDTREAFHEYYDGERGSIPDEYRVMTFQDDLPEEEKSEWAMDIAFDMDEFFRQNDPQYAAEHPEAHAAKEELYESLMAGRISTLDEKLAAQGQTQEDYLPSEIDKFKDATG